MVLSVDGDADAAVEARVCRGWNKLDNSCHCLPIRMSHFLWEGNYTQVVCVVVCYIAVKRDQW